MSEKIPFYFLMCSERSGSNFITKLLNAHTQICGPSPNHTLRAFSQNRLNYGDLNKDENWNIFLNDLLNYLSCQLAAWETKVTENDLVNLPRKVSSVLRFIFEKEGKEHKKNRLFIKENQVYNYFEWIESNFTDSKYIYLVRDVRDVALSWKKSTNHPGAIKKAVSIWKKDQEEFLKLYNRLTKRNCITLIKYENLVSDTEHELKKLCSNLKVNFEKEMLNFHKDKLTIKNAKKIDNWSNLSNPVLSSNYNKFKNELEDWEIRFIEHECCELLNNFNYELEFKSSEKLNDTIKFKIDEQENLFLNVKKNNLSPKEQEIRSKRQKAIKQIIGRKL